MIIRFVKYASSAKCLRPDVPISLVTAYKLCRKSIKKILRKACLSSTGLLAI